MLIKIGATFHFYDYGSGPIYTYNCVSPTGHGAVQSAAECALTLNMSCSHANDAGVRCLGFEDVRPENDSCSMNMIKVNDAPSTSS